MRFIDLSALGESLINLNEINIPIDVLNSVCFSLLNVMFDLIFIYNMIVSVNNHNLF